MFDQHGGFLLIDSNHFSIFSYYVHHEYHLILSLFDVYGMISPFANGNLLSECAIYNLLNQLTLFFYRYTPSDVSYSWHVNFYTRPSPATSAPRDPGGYAAVSLGKRQNGRTTRRFLGCPHHSKARLYPSSTTSLLLDLLPTSP